MVKGGQAGSLGLGKPVRVSLMLEAPMTSMISASTLIHTMKTQNVVFRVFREGDVIALFCNTAKDCNPGNVMCYQHIGQHGEASRHIGIMLRLATPEEYAPLLRELNRAYYPIVFQPVNRLRA
jgi:hypothetical protein